LGATVRIVDGDSEDARQLARQIADSEGAFLVEDSENIDTCEGAGGRALNLPVRGELCRVDARGLLRHVVYQGEREDKPAIEVRRDPPRGD